MKAIAQNEFGDAGVLSLQELPDPLVGPDQVLVAVKAASVNPVDWKIRQGYVQGGLPHHFPLIQGGLDPFWRTSLIRGRTPLGRMSLIMGTMGKKKPQRPRRSFTPEFKAEIVELCQRGDRSIGQVAGDFDLTETAVREWVKQAERDTGDHTDSGLTSQEKTELAALRRENRRLREDNEILKRATAFFARETR